MSAWCQGELEDEEVQKVAQLQAKNRELRFFLGASGCNLSTLPCVEPQVQKYLQQLRRAVADNGKLRADLVRVKEGLAPRRVSCAQAAGETQVNNCESGKLADSVYAEIQATTKDNIDLISQYDEQVRTLESDIQAENRRKQEAEMQLRMPPSIRTLSPPPNYRSTAEDVASELAISELRSSENRCAQLSREIGELTAERVMFEQSSMQELRLSQKTQVEEIMRLRMLLNDHQSSRTNLETAGTTQLLEAEWEQLQEHLAQVQQTAVEERMTADQQTLGLRKDIASLEKECASTDRQKESVLCELKDLGCRE